MDRTMGDIRYKQIGVIHSPFKEVRGTPIQPTASNSSSGVVELFPEFQEGLEDLDGFSHITLIYHFHLARISPLKITPYMDTKARGVFATRAPSRPNPIGISTVRLVKVAGNRLHVEDIDIVDGTPLLDIKPYVPMFDVRDSRMIGWLGENIGKLDEVKDDGRFEE
jgi:tRNA-Thr(GGU) m(6)t(6)A37 methyltransferase TsaA